MNWKSRLRDCTRSVTTRSCGWLPNAHPRTHYLHDVVKVSQDLKASDQGPDHQRPKHYYSIYQKMIVRAENS